MASEPTGDFLIIETKEELMESDTGEDCCDDCSSSHSPTTTNLNDVCGKVLDGPDLQANLTQLLSTNPEDTTGLVTDLVNRYTVAQGTGLRWKITVWVTIGRWRICVTIRKKR